MIYNYVKTNSDGSVSIDDFLNDTSLVKRKLANYGMDPQVADVYLSSKIKIIEVIKTHHLKQNLKEQLSQQIR